MEYDNVKSATKHLKEYQRAHPKIHFDTRGQTEIDENYNVDSRPIGIKKYGTSSFRHKDKSSGVLNGYPEHPVNNNFSPEDQVGCVSQELSK